MVWKFQEEKLCDQYMGKFPVISISLKEAAGESFDTAKRILRSVIGDEALRFSFLSESDKLTETERQQYAKLIELDDRGEYAMSDELLSKVSSHCRVSCKNIMVKKRSC